MVQVAAVGDYELEAQDSATLAIRALANPTTIKQVTGVFAQRGLVPAFLSCQRAGPYLLIDVQLALRGVGIDATLLERLRALICVNRAEYVCLTK